LSSIDASKGAIIKPPEYDFWLGRKHESWVCYNSEIYIDIIFLWEEAIVFVVHFFWSNIQMALTTLLDNQSRFCEPLHYW
jgi:hypothetical protein